MVGTGANRMPLTKVHPILLGKQNKSDSGGSSLLAQSRQMHNERMQSGPSGGGGGQVMKLLIDLADMHVPHLRAPF